MGDFIDDAFDGIGSGLDTAPRKDAKHEKYYSSKEMQTTDPFLKEGLSYARRHKPSAARRPDMTNHRRDLAKSSLDYRIAKEIAAEDKQLTADARRAIAADSTRGVVLQVAYHQVPIGDGYSSFTYSLFGDRQLTVSGNNGTFDGVLIESTFSHLLVFACRAFKLVEAAGLERFGNPDMTEKIYAETSFHSRDVSCNLDYAPRRPEQQAFQHVLMVGYELQRDAVFSLGSAFKRKYETEIAVIRKALSSHLDK